jgi:hypothetical protein
MRDEGAHAIAEVLRTHPALQRLYLEDNGLTDNSGVAIARALAGNNVLVMLDLRNNELKDATAVALLEALEKNTTIADIEIAYNDFGFDAFVRSKRTIEQHKRELSSDIGAVAAKHVGYLRTQEQRLTQCRSEIARKESELVERKNEKEELIQKRKKEQKEAAAQLAEAEKKLAKVQIKYDNVFEQRRQKQREFNALRLTLDKRESEAIAEMQKSIVKRQNLQARVGHSEAKKLYADLKTGRTLGDLRATKEKMQNRLRALIDDVRASKLAQIEKERKEKNQDGGQKAPPKGKKTKRDKRRRIRKRNRTNGRSEKVKVCIVLLC